LSLLAVGSAITLLFTTMFVANVLAVHDEGVFQLEGNAVTAGEPIAGQDNPVSNTSGAHDWDHVYADRNYTGSPPFPTSGAVSQAFVTDVFGAGDSIFTGGSTKDIFDPQNSWLWRQTSTTSVQDKDDIEHAFAAQYNVDKSAAGESCGTGANNQPISTANCVLLYFGATRFSNSGNTTMGFWFFKNKVSLGANGAFTGVHSTGDVLVLANWGGSNPVGDITVYDWVGGKNPLRLVADNLGADCAKVGANDNFCAAVNRQTVSQPWSFADKAGSSTIRPLELFEAGINITDLFGQDRCFASFLAATRSSHSTTAQLKDFALGSFEQCGAAISISPRNACAMSAR